MSGRHSGIAAVLEEYHHEPEEEDATQQPVEDRLFSACARGDLATAVGIFAEDPGNLAARVDELGRTPLDIANYFGHKDIAAQIIALQLALIFPEHSHAKLTAAASCSSSLEEASVWLLDRADHAEREERSSATYADDLPALVDLRGIFPMADEALLRKAALRSGSVEEAAAWLLDARAERLDTPHQPIAPAASAASTASVQHPSVPFTVLLPPAEARALERAREAERVASEEASRRASMNALAAKERAQKALENQLRVRTIINGVLFSVRRLEHIVSDQGTDART